VTLLIRLFFPVYTVGVSSYSDVAFRSCLLHSLIGFSSGSGRRLAIIVHSERTLFGRSGTKPDTSSRLFGDHRSTVQPAVKNVAFALNRKSELER